MKTVERNVVRLAVVQHLRAAYGIKTKNWNKSKTNSIKSTACSSVKVFGIALESLPHCYVLDYGDIPCFVVDACTCLMGHLDTEGLFRKSGSIVRVKELRAKLEQAEECLPTALPLDVAGLLKLFFRELPEPVLTTELHSSFLKAQELPTVEEKTSATLLLSCVLPHENVNVLRFFLSFLRRVSLRCTENKMDSSNLSVIFAPTLFHGGEGTEKMNATTEKRLKLEAAVVQCLIDNAQDLGAVPGFILAKVPAMLGCEAGVFSPSDALEEGSASSGVKKRSRRSLGDMVNGALNKFKSSRTPSNTPQSDGTVLSLGTPVVMTPKRKLPAESAQSYGFSNKKRRSIKKNLGLELFPSTLFGGTSTPESVHSAAGSLDSTQHATPSVGRSSRLPASSARRKSKRLLHRNIGRVESGKAGCFSPRVTKKEATRKSLRLRFSLGKINRDCSVISHSQPVPKGSEVIGWRLATQESVTGFHFQDTVFSPAVLTNTSNSKGSKYISKSEDNLLTPCKTNEPWSGETPDGRCFPDTPTNVYLKTSYRSEPSIVVSKPLAVIPKGLCCATSAESLASSDSFSEQHPHLKMRGAYNEPADAFFAPVQDRREEAKERKESVASESLSELKEMSSVHVPQKNLVDDCSVAIEQFQIGPLSPLHIDSALFEHEDADNLVFTKNMQESSLVAENGSYSLLDSSAGPADGSRLVDALDIQSPMAFKVKSAITIQSTQLSARGQTEELAMSQHEEFMGPLQLSELSEHSDQRGGPTHNEKECVRGSTEPGRMRVADHVKRFNMLMLTSPKAKVDRSPVKFQRTPVRQSVRRINSLLGQRRETRSGWCAASQYTVMKSVSLESGLSIGMPQPPKATEVSSQPLNDEGVFLKPKLPAPAKKKGTCYGIRHCALEDVTNTVAPKAKGSVMSEVQASVLLQPAEKVMSHYRGSPRNPLTQGKLLSAMKPLDL